MTRAMAAPSVQRVGMFILNEQGQKMNCKLPLIIAAISLLTGCTFVRYDQGALTVIDLHPGGESIALDGVLNDRGALSVNREQGSNAEIIGAAVDAAVGL